MTNQKRVIKFIGIGISLGLIVWLALNLDLPKIWSIIIDANLLFLAFFLALNLVAIMLSSCNLYLLLHALRQDISWRKLFYFDLLAIIWSILTPGGVGGIAAILYKTNESGIKIKACMTALFIDKLVTLFIAFITLGIYIVFWSSIDLISKWIMLLASLSLVIFTISLVLLIEPFRMVLLRIIKRIPSYAGLLQVIAKNITITSLIFFISGMQYLLAFYSVGVEFPDPKLIFLTYGALLLINYLPISISGIGLTEITVLYLWVGPGIEAEQVISALIIVRVFSIFSTVMLSGGALTTYTFLKRRRPMLQ